MTRLTATEAARNFSDVLNRVAAGEDIEIVRNGASVAVIGHPGRGSSPLSVCARSWPGPPSTPITRARCGP